MVKVVFLDQSTITLGDIDFSCLKRLGEYADYPSSTEMEAIERSRGVQVMIVNKVPVTMNVIRSLPELKLVCVIATGYNNVDLPAAGEAKVTVCNVAGYAVNTVPQHTFALILNLATQIHRYDADVKAGAWQKTPIFTILKYPTFELAGKTIGIIGFGAIGRGIARIAEGFGMNVLAYDPMGIKHGKYHNTDLEVLLKESDIVTLHCPLTEQTRNLIDQAALSKMKKTALLINTARGGIVDEPALAEALNNGRIAGAGFDVLTQEPPKNGNVLLQAKNLILTPHSAWSTVEARQKLVDETAENIKAFFEGKPRNVVS
jgi:glycerate dehydrogenase